MKNCYLLFGDFTSTLINQSDNEMHETVIGEFKYYLNTELKYHEVIVLRNSVIP